MAYNTDIATISQTPALNGPDGTDLPSTLDDAIRYSISFTAKLRDGVGFSAGAIVAGLGYTPVVRGGIAGTDTNAVNIGYNPTLSKMVVASNGNSFSNTWPIDITGNAATSTNATTAANANALGGSGSAEYVRRWSADTVRVGWNGSLVIIEINGNAFGGVIPMAVPWSLVQSRPSDLGSFSNGPGYMVDADVIRRAGSVTNMSNIGSANLTANIAGFGLVSWSVVPSDARLKKDIAPTMEDSLAKISRIDFRQFRFRDDVTDAPVDDGRLHRVGVIAQELDAIDSAWVNRSGTWLAPDQQALLYEALHAVKQLGQVVQQQAAEIADLKVRTGAGQ